MFISENARFVFTFRMLLVLPKYRLGRISFNSRDETSRTRSLQALTLGSRGWGISLFLGKLRIVSHHLFAKRRHSWVSSSEFLCIGVARNDVSCSRIDSRALHRVLGARHRDRARAASKYGANREACDLSRSRNRLLRDSTKPEFLMR